ncbi:MAG TPA: glycosyltransferase [Pirellulales bacterium]|nr:glycosyltransferase [Pirellulales bacterium]
MIKTWAGRQRHDFRYIRRSLPSLLASALPEGARVVIVNDQSTDPRLEPFLKQLAAGDARVELWTNPERMGPNRGQAYNFPRILERFPNAKLFGLCDDDIVYHPGWLQRLVRVSEEAAEAGLSGIFSAINFPTRPCYASVQLPTSEVLLKERQAAFNWLVPRDIYERVGPFRDAGVAFDTDYANRMAPLGIPVICLKPSFVQNIGYLGAYQSDNSHTARDYVGNVGWYLRAHSMAWTMRGYAARLARGATRRVSRIARAYARPAERASGGE